MGSNLEGQRRSKKVVSEWTGNALLTAIYSKKNPTGLFTRIEEPKSVALSKVQRSKMFRVGV